MDYSDHNDRRYYGEQPPLVNSPSPVSQFDPRQGTSAAATPAPSYHTYQQNQAPPYPPERDASSVYPPTVYSGVNRQDTIASQNPNSHWLPPVASPSPITSPPPINGPQDLPPRTSPSPFDTVFDDNAYPMNSRQNLAAGSTSDMSQRGFYQDTSYGGAYGQQNRPLNSTDDIPLQDRAHKDADPEMDLNDHVYDDPNAGKRRRKRDKKVPLGGFGMFGSDKKRIPWVCYIFTVAQVGVFIGEIVRNATLTGSPIMIKPQFNYMIGPSSSVLINMGARFAPCMRNIGGDEWNDIPFLCPDSTSNLVSDACTYQEVCGFSTDTKDGNQWWRFVVPIFLHAGLIHIAFNMLLQLTLGRDMEKAIGSLRFILVYLPAGIFGFIMGGNFAPPGIASTGASGSLFGIIALTLLDLLYSWKERKSPIKDLLFIFADIIISFVLGLLPGLDNFSHIGGFLMGLALGITVLHSPNALRLKIGEGVSYSTVPEAADGGPPPFFKNPVGFFKGRKPLWWVWWLVRAAALVIIIVVFIVLLDNFYKNTHTCGWCKYLSCLPVNGWCKLGILEDQKQTRALFL
ncbi:hypothetical protein N3K66_006685 [Trichothecium roseum]|uniref:Uncharacterized protein n=1 Tax=Trichothecium roseum TaxID=47278 RepID=A0ACC0UVZ8_9HYPO|nr:hypothetical protein N3K66_006685 [Trichothecium roseum]